MWNYWNKGILCSYLLLGNKLFQNLMATHNNYLLSLRVSLGQIFKQGTVGWLVSALCLRLQLWDLKSGARIHLMVAADGELWAWPRLSVEYPLLASPCGQRFFTIWWLGFQRKFLKKKSERSHIAYYDLVSKATHHHFHYFAWVEAYTKISLVAREGNTDLTFDGRMSSSHWAAIFEKFCLQ